MDCKTIPVYPKYPDLPTSTSSSVELRFYSDTTSRPSVKPSSCKQIPTRFGKIQIRNRIYEHLLLERYTSFWYFLHRVKNV